MNWLEIIGLILAIFCGAKAYTTSKSNVKKDEEIKELKEKLIETDNVIRIQIEQDGVIKNERSKVNMLDGDSVVNELRAKYQRD